MAGDDAVGEAIFKNQRLGFSPAPDTLGCWVLMISAMITGGVLQKYEAAFAALPLLVTFIPMLTDTGGNAGSQSATLIIRGMALSEIRMKDALKVLWKELRVALLVGLVLPW